MRHSDQRLRIRPDLTTEQFFAALKECGASYVVLRWFEALPQIEAGHDLDLLVADADLPKVQPLLVRGPRGQLCDLYSVTGQGGFTYRPAAAPAEPAHEMAVFPPHLAQRLLDAGGLQDDLYRVPCPEDHFFSLAYHATYLKGSKSGLPSAAAPSAATTKASHDYAVVLSELAKNLGMPLCRPLTLEALDELLATAGWRPPYDVLERLAPWHPWIARKFFSTPAAADGTDDPGMVAFLLRDQAIDGGFGPGAEALATAFGFEIIAETDLEGDLRERALRSIRGGNWACGPWPVSGGAPRKLLVALDLLPRLCTAEMARRFPQLDNGRIPEIKDRVRAWINERCPPELRFNALHSTDNSRATWDVVRTLLPDEEARLRALVRARRAEFTTKEEVIADLTRFGNRAKVELVRWAGGLAVKKTFRPHALRFLRHELEIYDRFSSERAELLPVLARGTNYFVLPYVDDMLGQASRLPGSRRPPHSMPLWAARQLVNFIEHLLSQGYDPVDLAPANNVLLGPGRRLWVIDLEFVHHREPGTSLEQSWCLGGVPPGASGDLPAGAYYLHAPYATQWYPVVSLGCASLLYDPAWQQHVKRIANRSVTLLEWATQMGWRASPAILRRLRRMRRSGRYLIVSLCDRALPRRSAKAPAQG